MDNKTYELYPNIKDAWNELVKSGVREEEVEERLIPLSAEEYSHLQGMNRQQRRKWLRTKNRSKI